VDAIIEFLKHLSRGWQFKPEAGDNDMPYQRPNQQ
jgi:hypothetical protein